ncbi:MAG: alanine--tRNA ligase-related protein [Faecousia sp.]
METGKLYYEDCHLARFTARVLRCEEGEGIFRVTLDATAFYPEGGGQPGDTGTLGGVTVLDTREEGGEILHLCREPLRVGETVEGCVDYDRRFGFMQQHTGEHMVSGILHRRMGLHNTGFHIGAEGVTVDFDGVVPPELLPEIEEEANRGVWRNIPLHIFTPSPEELPGVTYRTKRTLPWPVRIVEIPGFDSCACCGVHCAATGEVGLIKLFSSIPFRGGSRILMACGGLALSILNRAYAQNKLVSQAFSAPMGETGEAASRMNDLLAQQKYRITALERRIWDGIAEGYRGKGNVLHFEPGLDGTGIRELADRIAASCGGTAAVFSGEEGSFGFCLASRADDLRPLGKRLTQALCGRGGGKPGFQQGAVKASRQEIEAFFRDQPMSCLPGSH